MSARPVSGVRVVEVGQFKYVPVSGAVLADWGADAIKVEQAVGGDAKRGLRNLGGTDFMGGFAPLMEHPNRSKRGIGLSLEKPEALEVLHDLVRNSDVFVTNFLTDTRARLGINVEHIRAINPTAGHDQPGAVGGAGDEEEGEIAEDHSSATERGGTRVLSGEL